MTDPILYKKFFLTAGSGDDEDAKLLAFDKALMEAGINQCNLVSVSSILPNGAQLIHQSASVIQTGEIVFCVLARSEGVKGEGIFSGIGYALGYDKNTKQDYGFVLEGTSKVGGPVLRKQLKNGLETMAKLRNFVILTSNTIINGMGKIEARYGCSIAALIYRS